MAPLFTLIIFALLVVYLWSAIRAKEIAVRAGRKVCQDRSVQFLDETVEQKHVSFGLDPRKNPCWIRRYHFEFATDGQYRYGGSIKMYGHRVHQIEMDPYAIEPTMSDEYLH